MSSSIFFREMTIISLEHQQSPATGAAAKMSYLSSLSVSATRLKRIQKLLCSGVCAHASIIGQRGQDTLEYLN